MDSSYKWNRESNKSLWIDSIEHPVDSLETIIPFLKREDNLKWKWVTIALHSALYQLCIANLEGTNYEDVLSTGNDKECYFSNDEITWYSLNPKYKLGTSFYTIEWTKLLEEPKVKHKKRNKKSQTLLGIWDTLARVQDDKCFMARSTCSKALILSDEEIENIINLVEFRNNFIHFVPYHRSIDIDIFEKILKSLIRPLNFLALQTNQIVYSDLQERERVKVALNEITQIMKL